MRSLLRVALGAVCGAILSVALPTPGAGQLDSYSGHRSFCPIAYAAERNDNTPVSRCIDTSKSETDSGLDVEFSNDCDTAVTCEVRWTVTCQSAKGKRTLAGMRNLRIAKEAKTSMHASANACGSDSWEISDPTWTCQPSGG